MHPRNASIAISQADQSAKGARAFIRRKAKRSIPATSRHTDPAHNAIVIMRCHGQAYVTKRYSLPPIDSPILRSTMREMTIAYKIKNADPTYGIDHNRL